MTRVNLSAFLPGAQLETDNYGQIIIYTDLTETPDGTLGVFDEGEPT